MGLFDRNQSTSSVGDIMQRLFTNQEQGTKKTGQLGLFNTALDANIPVDVNVSSPTTNDSRINFSAPQTQKVFSPQYNIITGSPNAVQTTTKKDAVSADNTPEVTSQPRQAGAQIPVEIPLSVGNSSSLLPFLLLGGAGFGLYLIAKKKVGK